MLHLALKETIEQHFAADLAAPLTLLQDALQLQLRNGVVVELRFASTEEYSLAWLWGDAELRIDTAPLHHDLATFPNHLHDADGQLRADPLTQPGRAPWDNVRPLLAALLADPLLA